MEQLSGLEDISHKAMTGKYIPYYRGGIYDDRVLIKSAQPAADYMANAKYELPYGGAKEMLLANNADNKEYLTEMFNGVFNELSV